MELTVHWYGTWDGHRFSKLLQWFRRAAKLGTTGQEQPSRSASTSCPHIRIVGILQMSSRAKIFLFSQGCSRTGLILLLHVRIFRGSYRDFHLIVFKLLFMRSFYCATKVKTQRLQRYPTSSSGRISPFPTRRWVISETGLAMWYCAL